MVAQKMESLVFKIVEEDKCLAKATSVNRKLMDFIYEICTYPFLKLIFTRDSLLRIYHLRSQTDILYLDATGSIIEKIKQYNFFCCIH